MPRKSNAVRKTNPVLNLVEPTQPKRSLLEPEIGATGTAFFPGMLKSEEYNAEMKGSKAAKNYEKMRRSDAQIRATLMALKLPILSATWTVESEDKKVKEFLREALFDRIDFHNFLKHALLMFDFGYELMEKVYEADQGRVWVKKLAHRGQSTIYEWKVDDEGNLTAVVQNSVWKAGKYVTAEIPIDRLVHFAFDQEGNNFEGISVLRSAYPHWYIKTNLYRIDAIAHERFGIGVPYMKMPDQINPNDKTAAETTMKNYKAGAQSWFLIPYGWEAGIMGAGEGSTRYDPMPTIKHHDEMISRNILATFLNLGTTETGARALGESSQGLFISSLQATASQIVTGVNRQVIRPLLDLNFGPGATGSLRYADLESRNTEILSNALSRLGLSGFITPDPDLEAHLRDILDVTQKPGEISKAAKERRHPRHIHLDEGAPMEPGREGFWRDLTEMEKSMSLREIRGHGDDAKQHLIDIIDRVKDRWADSLKEQVADALSDGDPSDVGDITIPAEMMQTPLNATVDVFRDLYRYGRRSIQEEERRQKKMARLTEVIILRDEPPESNEVTDMFWVRARQYFGRLSQRVENRARDLALTLYRTRKADFTDADLNELADDVLSVADTSAKLEANVLVNEAFNMGRMEEMEIRKDDIEKVVYTAILDETVCDPCRDVDGEEFEIDSEEYFENAPPNKNCEGGDRCRCMYGAIFK